MRSTPRYAWWEVSEFLPPEPTHKIDLLSLESVRLFRNGNWFLRAVGTDNDRTLAANFSAHVVAYQRERLKRRLHIRLPNDYHHA